jgi:hypothetical protein
MPTIQASAPSRVRPKPQNEKKPDVADRIGVTTQTTKPSLTPDPHGVDKKTEKS